MKSHITAPIVFFLLAAGISSAQQTTSNPNVISYQGIITSNDGTPLIDGEYPITVTLYGDEGGVIKIWQDTYMTTVRGGVFSMYLGSGNIPLPAPSQMDKAFWIGTRISGGDEMRPLTRLGSSPYAINVPDNAITTAKLADGAVTADKVNLDYISGVSVNGEKLALDGRMLNIQAGKDIEIKYDEMSQSLVIGAPAGVGAGPDKKGERDRELQVTPNDAWAAQGDKIDVISAVKSNAISSDWIGTSGSVPFTAKVNSQRVMVYQPNGTLTPSIIGGYFSNAAAPAGDGNIIAGGGTAGFPNTINGAGYNVIAGGAGNSIPNTGSVFGAIGGGQSNTIGSAGFVGHYSVIGGGFQNVVTGNLAVVGGGRAHSVSAEYGTAGGGIGSVISGWIGTVAGGDGNEVHGQKGAIGGGYRNKIFSNGSHATIAGGYTNTINDQFSSIGGGQSNKIEAQYGVISGGFTNSILNAGSFGSAIGGGQNNVIGSAATFVHYGTIGGGFGNQVTGILGTISGGRVNSVSNEYGSVGGGIGNIISGWIGTIAGGDGNEVHAVKGAIGGGYRNKIFGNGSHAAIAGGYTSTIDDQFGSVGGGFNNQIVNGGYAAAIPGGENLIAQSYGQTVVGLYNIPRGNISPGTPFNDDPIFIVGNGDIHNTGIQSNAFEVSYNGHSTVFHNTHGITPVISGSTYTDNVIYAWGTIDPSGNPICKIFGVSNIQPVQNGFMITLDIVDPNGNPVQINCGSVTATIATLNGPGGGGGSNAIISVSQIVNNQFDVYILDAGGNPVPEAFSFKVTGRP